MDPEIKPEDAIVTPEDSKVKKVAEAPVVETPPKKEAAADGSEAAPKPVTRAEGEDSERFNLRQQLKVAQQNFVAAADDGEKSLFKDEMKKIRTQLYQHSIDTKPTNQTPTDTTPAPTADEEKAIRENLKKLGYVTKDEALAEARKIVTEEMSRKEVSQNVGEHAKVIADFYASRPDIASDEDLKQGLEAYVIQNFKVTPTTKPEALAQYMKMAGTFFVPVSKTEDTAAKDAQDKVDLLNITGGNSTTQKQIDASKKEEVAHLKSMGWSDAKIANFYK